MGEGLGGPVLEAVDAPDQADPLDRPEHAARAVDATPGRVRRARSERSSRRTALQFWRSPDDQPVWARPVLLAIAALAALSYAWGMGSDTLETFYAAAVRSMSESWHNFFFASFDPWGTVSVDKLPGSFWVQALSVRVFGFHTWSLVLPQAVEGTLTVLVLYRAVRRVAGAGAGLVAAAALAATPVTILLNRGNISDTLLILLLVLAADATIKAITTGRLQPLLLAGLWVGLAFQTKMLQAWLVLPALLLAYLVAAPTPDLVRRVGHVLLCALIALGVSLSWMVAISAVPAHDRPYVDASCNDSVFSQVFLYNGADRLSGHTLVQPGCTRAAGAAAQGPGAASTNKTVAVPRGPGRFLNGPFGRDGDWLLVPATVAFVGILVARRRAPRTDALRSGALLWAAWLFFTWSFFADSHFLNSYYLAALAPPIAALFGMGVALAWRLRAQRGVRAVLLGTVAAGTAYALYLVPTGAGVRSWVIASTLLLAVAALVATARSLGKGAPGWAAGAGVVLSAAALFAGSAWAASTVVEAELGPFDSPYQPAAAQAHAAAAARTAADDTRLQRAAARVPPGVSVLTVATSATAGGAILATGREFLPVGGFTGRVPSPTLRAFVADVRSGKVADVLVPASPPSHNPDMEWVSVHCAAQPATALGASLDLSGQPMRLYRCSPIDTSATAATGGAGFTAQP